MAMRVVVDRRKCEGFGSCVILQPDVFELGDEDDLAYVKMESPPEEMRVDLEEAALSCPVDAIQIRDE
jgi:ferredoxin